MRFRFVMIGLLLLIATISGTAQESSPDDAPLSADLAPIFTNEQFVMTPAARQFDLSAYLNSSVPHLLRLEAALTFHAHYYSIDARILLTWLEATEGLLSDAEAADSIPLVSLESYLEFVAEALYNGYYGALYHEIGTESLPERFSINAQAVTAPQGFNAASYALLFALDAVGTQPLATYNALPFVYRQWFGEPPQPRFTLPDPNGINRFTLPAQAFQFPYEIGANWVFNGVHNWDGSPEPRDMSSIDLSPIANFSQFGYDTSDAWVVAARGGTVTFTTPCWVVIAHEEGWETAYYHLENVVVSTGQAVSANQRIGRLADTFAEATCNGGWSSGPHVHFALLRNGQYMPIQDFLLSAWRVNPGRNSYDANCQFMYLERNTTIVCPYSLLANDALQDITLGDCNSDGVLDAADLGALNTEIASPGSYDATRCDANGSGAVTAADRTCARLRLFDPAVTCQP